MISDTLTDAIVNIEKYQKEDNTYEGYEDKINAIKKAMNCLRLELDIFPGVLENIDNEKINELYGKLYEIASKIQLILEKEVFVYCQK